MGFDGANDGDDGLIEIIQDFFLGRTGRFGEFLGAISDVAGLGDIGADVVVEIAGQVEDEVSDAVAEGEGVRPEFVVGQECGLVVQGGG